MLNKLFTNSAITAYGPSFPTSNISDGTIFYKTEASGGFNPGFYVYRIISDSDSVTFGPQPSQGWASADISGVYVKRTGDTMTGTLELVNYLKISNGTTDQRLVIGNTSATQPTIINSKNKVMVFGLGTSFAGNGGTMETFLKLDFTDVKDGIKWKNSKVWHQGNDGPASGLDADLLDGYHGSFANSPNTYTLRNADKNIYVDRVHLDSPDSENPAINQFVVTGTDGLTRKANVSHTTESIRLHIDTVTPRRTWNINVSGNAGTATAVPWTGVSSKPSWLEDGQVAWEDISFKPTNFYRFVDGVNSPKPVEFTKARVKEGNETVYTEKYRKADTISGFYAYNSLDFPTNANTFPDPVDLLPWQIETQPHWIGMQVVTADNPAAQLAFHWSAEDLNPDGTVGNSDYAHLVYRINDDNGLDSTSFSKWYKVWTNASLKNVSQLKNDAEYVSSGEIGTDYLSKTSTSNQDVLSFVSFKGGIHVRSTSIPGNIIELKENGHIQLSGASKISTATGNIETTSGNIYSENGKIWTTSGDVWSTAGLVGAGGTIGTAYLFAGYTQNLNGVSQNLTGGIKLTGGTQSQTFGRIMGNMTGWNVRYELNPDSTYPNEPTTAHHWFNRTIKTTGDVVAYASDERLKLNITPISNAVEKVKIISGVTFDWDMKKCESIKFQPANEHEHGLIAQRVQEVMPDAVTVCPASDDYLTVRYERIVSLLTAAVTEQQVMIDELKREVAEMKSKFN